jgi:ice-binding like protein
MFTLPRRTARLAVIASFAALLTAACNTDSKNVSGLSGPTLSAEREDGGGGSNSSRGASSSFAVLANAAVTCTNGTITGDVGTFQATPTGSVTLTSCPVTGGIHVGDGAAIQAYNAFLSQYSALATTPCGVVLTGTLAGVTLAPGVYCFDAAATLTGVLTLNGPASGVWLFKIGTSGTGALTGTNFSVVMAGGGQACNVTWWVSQAATMTDSDLKGSILAGAAITLTRGTFAGNAWAGASGVGDVTITGTAVVGCTGATGEHKHHKHHEKCNQGVGNGSEGCDPGNSDHHNGSNDENGGTPGDPGRQPDGR